MQEEKTDPMIQDGELDDLVTVDPLLSRVKVGEKIQSDKGWNANEP